MMLALILLAVLLGTGLIVLAFAMRAEETDPAKDAEIVAWLEALREVPSEQRTPIHDALVVETFRAQIDRYGRQS